MTNYYVSPSGSSGNNGTSPSTPKATIAQAMSLAGAGDTILVADGSYPAFSTSKGGSSGNFLTVKSQTQYGATLNGDMLIQHEYFRLENFEILGDQFSCDVTADHTRIVGNKIHGAAQGGSSGNDGGSGIEVYNSDNNYGPMNDVVISGNIIYNIGPEPGADTLVQGIYVTSDGNNTCIVENNVVYDVEDFGIHGYTSGGPGETSDWIIRNNTIIGCGRGILTTGACTVRNNISGDNLSDDYDIRSGGTVQNNIVFGGGSTGTGITSVSDPKFVNKTAFDLRLQSTSPCINAGTATGAPATDLLGVTRPQGGGIDCGAYEFTTADPGPGPGPGPGVTGVTRCELREMQSGGTVEAAWPLASTYRQLTVTGLFDPSSVTDLAEMLAAGIRSTTGAPLLLAVEYEAASPRLRAYKDGTAAGDLLTGLAPTTQITIRIRVQAARVKVWAAVGTVASLPVTPQMDVAAGDFATSTGCYLVVGSQNRSTVQAAGTGQAVAKLSHLELLQSAATQQISPDMVADTSAVFEPEVVETPGPSIRPSSMIDTSMVWSPGVDIPPVQTIEVGSLIDTSAVYAPRIPRDVLGQYRNPLRIDFWAYNDDGSLLAPLPQPCSWSLSLVPGEVGAIQVEYPVDGINYNILDERVTRKRDLRVAVRIDGTHPTSLGGYLQARSGDEVAEGGTVTFHGAFNTLRLAEAVLVYNSLDEKGETRWANATAGRILNDLLTAAQARGTLTDLTWTFDEFTDSQGVPWSYQTSPVFSPHTPYLKVAQTLRAWGMVEFEITTDLEVRAYDPGTVGTDWTSVDPPMVFRAGRDLTEAPRRTDITDAATALYVSGKDGIYVTASDATAEAQRGRRIEQAVSEGNLTDTGSATAYAHLELARRVQGEDELTHALTFDQDQPVPLRELWPLDWVYSDRGTGLGEPERIAQITVQQQQGDTGYSGSITLRDLLESADEVLARKLDGLAGGQIVTGTSEQPGSGDTMPPAAPTGVNAASVAYPDGSGGTLATLTVSWLKVTTSADGSPAGDVAGYRVQWRTPLEPMAGWIPGPEAPGKDTVSVQFGGVAAGVTVDVQVAAYDSSGNQSAWSEPPAQLITETDTTPPPIPSAPVVTSRLGILSAEWDGLGAALEQMPLDFYYVEIHVSQTSDFIPDSTTYYDRLFGAGSMPITDQPYGATVFVRLVGVDRTLNLSAPSAQGSGSASKVVSDDIFDGAIGSAKLAELAVKSINIDHGAVNSLQVGSIEVGKLATGTFTAQLTLSGIFRTGTTGARGEWDSTSFRQYNPAGTLTTEFRPSGVSFMTGEFRSALSGQRFVLNPGGTVADEMRLYPSGGGDFARIFARTAPADGSAAILIHGGAAAGAGRGALGAYKGEGFISWVSTDTGGDTESGFSRTAVSCGPSNILAWTQGVIQFSKRNGNQAIAGTTLNYQTATFGGVARPLLSAPEAGIGLHFCHDNDAGINVLRVTNATGSSLDNLAALNVASPSGAESKTGIQDFRRVLTALDVIKRAPAKAWKYREEVRRRGPNAPLRFGPIAEDLPPQLVTRTSQEEGGFLISLGSQIGVLWAAVQQLQAQRITSTSTVAVVPLGTVIPAGGTVDVPVLWESSPLAAPTDALVFVQAGLLGARKVTAWIVPDTVDGSGCTVRFRNISPGPVGVAGALGGLTTVSATVVGQALYTPPLAA